jgi:molybdopterin converting factor small subunit
LADAVAVEFFGIARQRAGTPKTAAAPGRLGDVLADLAERFPRFGEECVDGRALRDGFLANVNGERFVHDPDVALRPGDALLVFSADAGG